MNHNQKILGLLGICTKAGEIVFGTDACKEAIQKNKVHLVLVAEDASDRTKRNFEFLCETQKLAYQCFGTIEELSKAIGKKNKAVIAIKNQSLAKELVKIINGGDTIG